MPPGRPWSGAVAAERSCGRLWPTPAKPPVKALAVYGKLVEDHAQFGRYEEAIHLVKRMASLRDAAEQATYVADLKERHKRKRNFMKLL
jgi:hypothetical protein